MHGNCNIFLCCLLSVDSVSTEAWLIKAHVLTDGAGREFVIFCKFTVEKYLTSVGNLN